MGFVPSPFGGCDSQADRAEASPEPTAIWVGAGLALLVGTPVLSHPSLPSLPAPWAWALTSSRLSTGETCR